MSPIIQYNFLVRLSSPDDCFSVILFKVYWMKMTKVAPIAALAIKPNININAERPPDISSSIGQSSANDITQRHVPSANTLIKMEVGNALREKLNFTLWCCLNNGSRARHIRVLSTMSQNMVH